MAKILIPHGPKMPGFRLYKEYITMPWVWPLKQIHVVLWHCGWSGWSYDFSHVLVSLLTSVDQFWQPRCYMMCLRIRRYILESWWYYPHLGGPILPLWGFKYAFSSLTCKILKLAILSQEAQPPQKNRVMCYVSKCVLLTQLRSYRAIKVELYYKY